MRSLFYWAVSFFFSVSVSSALSVQIIDQSSDEIQVLKAEIRSDLRLLELIDRRDCERISGGRDRRLSGRYSYNCAWALANRLGGAPLFPILEVAFNGRNFLISDLFDAESPIVEIYTITRLETWKKIDRIGFSPGDLGGRKFTWSKEDSKEIRRIRLRDGHSAIVHKWVYPLINKVTVGGPILRELSFKPFVSIYDGVADREIRRWDNFMGDAQEQNYTLTLGRPGEVPHLRIDRSDELIDPLPCQEFFAYRDGF